MKKTYLLVISALHGLEYQKINNVLSYVATVAVGMVEDENITSVTICERARGRRFVESLDVYSTGIIPALAPSFFEWNDDEKEWDIIPFEPV